MAFVVIFQMNPAANNQLASVLSRHTKMPVIVPTTGMPIRKNHVYVIPPNADLCIESDTFKVISPCTNKGGVVDLFLVSLAGALGPRAIAVKAALRGTCRWYANKALCTASTGWSCTRTR
jgi:two-component system CheB/CheR fusion protein